MAVNTIDLPAARSPDAAAALQAAALNLYSAWTTKDLDKVMVDRKLPVEFVSSIEAFFDAYDAYVEVVGSKSGVQCRSGCSFCCYDNPRGSTPIELLRLYAFLKQRDDYDRLQKKIRSYALAFDDLVKETADESKAQKIWKSSGRYCPMLSDDKRCSVYSKRPIPCRMFVSLTTAEWCHPFHPNHSSAINPHLEPLAPMRRLLLDIGEKMGLSDLPSDLFRGLDQLSRIFEDKEIDFTPITRETDLIP